MFSRRKTMTNDYAKTIDRLMRKVEEWERLATNARERDTGDHASLRECRPYPDGYWTGVAYGLETAAQELRAIIQQLESR